MTNLIIIFIIWIVLNGIFPLLLKSIDRQYKENIDTLVKGIVGVIKQILIRCLQLFLIFLFFPSIFIGFVVKNKQFKSKNMQSFFIPFVLLKDGFLESNFPTTLVEGFKAWKNNSFKLGI